MSRRRASFLGASLRKRRALTLALGSRRWEYRPLDRRGRYSAYFSKFPRVCKTRAEAIAFCHRWLDRMDPDIDSWWFHLREFAYDSTGRYHVVCSWQDVLVYRETLWTGYREPFAAPDRREVCYG